MKLIKIYQTVENRGNKSFLEKEGPCFCSLHDNLGNLKTGVKEPWLGAGYYFWDTLIEDARWWGVQHYRTTGYMIGETMFDVHSDLLLDLVGDIEALNYIIRAAELIKDEKGWEKVTFPYLLETLKKLPGFTYKAIRVCPIDTIRQKKASVFFPSTKDARYSIAKADKVQICFFDKTLLTHSFIIVETIEKENVGDEYVG